MNGVIFDLLIFVHINSRYRDSNLTNPIFNTEN